MDLAVSVPPSLEVVGDTPTGTIDLAVRIQLRDEDQGRNTASSIAHYVMTSTLPEAHSAPATSDVLEDYLATCKDACDGEINRLYAPGQRGSNGLYDLILDYPLRGGKALRPALSIATCLGLGGHLEAILPTAATLELYHNAFLIHDDIEDESWSRRGKPTLHIDHGIPIAVNVGDAMLSLSLQPLLDNVERVGLGPALRILRAVAHMTRRTVEGQALELDWVRSNTWQLDDADYLEMVELKTSWYSFITPLQVGAVAAGAGPESVGAAGVSRPTPRGGVSDHRRPAEPARGPGGLRQGDRRRPLGGQADPDAVARLAKCERRGAESRRADPGQAPPERRQRATAPDLLDRLFDQGDLSQAGRAEIAARLQGQRISEAKNLDDIRWLYGLMQRVGSFKHARDVAAGHARQAAAVLADLDWLPPSRHRDALAALVDYVHGRTR